MCVCTCASMCASACVSVFAYFRSEGRRALLREPVSHPPRDRCVSSGQFTSRGPPGRAAERAGVQVQPACLRYHAWEPQAARTPPPLSPTDRPICFFLRAVTDIDNNYQTRRQITDMENQYVICKKKNYIAIMETLSTSFIFTQSAEICL